MSVVLSEHLPLLASAPDGIQKLRGLILELAVRGKLVPQDPKDEPASELLKRITQERARLEAEGVCKKLKPLPPVSKDSQLFELPENWMYCPLGELATQVTDGTHHTPTYLPSGVPFISVKDINGATVSFTDCKYISKEQHLQINQRCNPEKGDILLCRIGTLGRPTIVDTDQRFSLFVSVGLVKLPKTIDLARYLHLVLASPSMARQYDSIKAGGSHTNKLNLGDIPTLTIPLPPLAEQHRIVAKVDELMALCDRLEAEQADAESAHARLVETLLGTLTQSTDAADLAANWQRLADHFDTLFTTESSLDALKQTILQLAVMGKLVPQDPKDEQASELLKRIAKERARLEAEGICKKSKPMPPVREDEQPFALPDGWHWVRFSSYALEISTGPFGSMLHQSDYRPGGIPLVNPSHMIGGRIVPESHIAVDEGKAIELSSYRLRCGDIVMARRGEVGRTALVTEAEDGWLCGTGSFVIRLAKDVSRTYVVMLFRTSSIRRYLGNEAVGTTMVNLNHGILNAMPLALPPLAEQHRIVAKVDELMALCDQLKAYLTESRTRQSRLSATLIESALAAA